MNKEIVEIKDIVYLAVKQFLANDIALLEMETHEIAVSHRIAVYLECLFKEKELNFDCEYNREGFNPKRDDMGELIRPDVLVHQRNNYNHNLLAIEVKKTNVEDQDDYKKLKYLTNQEGKYKYKLGLFLSFPKGKAIYAWFIGGKIETV